MPDTEQFEIVIPNDVSEGQAAQEKIIEMLERREFSPREVFSVRLAMEEALVNAIKHGNQMDPDKTVKLDGHVSAEEASISIEDQGEGFDPGDLPDPTADENLDLPGGRGVMLIQSFMDSVSYNEKGNRITMVKARSKETVNEAE